MTIRLPSRPLAGIRCPPVSLPRPYFLVRYLFPCLYRACSRARNSRDRVPPPGTTTPNGARSAGSCGDGETTRFYLLRFRGDGERSRFCFIRTWRFMLVPLLRSRLVTELRYPFDHSASQSLPLCLDYVLSRVDFALFDPLRLASFGTRLLGRIGIRIPLCAPAAIFRAKSRHICIFSCLCLIQSYCS